MASETISITKGPLTESDVYKGSLTFLFSIEFDGHISQMSRFMTTSTWSIWFYIWCLSIPMNSRCFHISSYSFMPLTPHDFLLIVLHIFMLIMHGWHVSLMFILICTSILFDTFMYSIFCYITSHKCHVSPKLDSY